MADGDEGLKWNANTMETGANGSRKIGQGLGEAGPQLESAFNAIPEACPSAKVGEVCGEIGSGLLQQIQNMSREIIEFGDSVTRAVENLGGADATNTIGRSTGPR